MTKNPNKSSHNHDQFIFSVISFKRNQIFVTRIEINEIKYFFRDRNSIDKHKHEPDNSFHTRLSFRIPSTFRADC